MTKKSKPDFNGDEMEYLAEFSGPGRATSSPRSSCPPPDVLRAAEEDVLPAHLQFTVAEHLAACAACRERKRIEEHIYGEIDQTPPSRFDGFGFMKWLIPATAAALLAIASISWIQPRSSESVEPPTTANQQEEAATTAPEPPAIGPIETATLRLDKPPVKLSGSLSLIFRSDGTSDGNQFLADFAPALDAYRSDDFNGAADTLEEVTRKHAGYADPYFYLGVSRMFLGEHEEAIRALERTRELGSATLAQDARWYLGLAHLSAGRVDTALPHFQSLCNETGDHREKACHGVKELSSLPRQNEP
jgi:tetratricopeptide (TPR) repeat protein